MRVAAHAERHQLDQRGPVPAARTFGRPRERRGDHVGVGPVNRDARNAVADGLVGKHARGGLIGQGRRQRNVIVLDAENRRQPSRRAEIDRFVPFAERRAAFADERHGDAARSFVSEGHSHARNRQRRYGKRRGGRQYPPAEIADVEVFAVERGPGLPHLGAEHHPDGLGPAPHGQRRAQVSDDRRDDISGPLALAAAVRRPAPQPYSRRVDGFLSERSKSLALKRRLTVSHLAIREERLQAVVGRPGQQHAAEHLDPFVARPHADGGAPEEPVAVVENLGTRQLHALIRHRSRHGLSKPRRERPRPQPARELIMKRHTKGIDAGLGCRDAIAVNRDEGIERFSKRQRMPLDDEGAKARRCQRCELLHDFGNYNHFAPQPYVQNTDLD
jgi:hypothetical protein